MDITEQKEESFYERIKREYPLCFAKNESREIQDPYCGFGCPEGWFPLVEALCAQIHWYTESKPEAKIAIAQVKSKFGSLRFYYDGGDDYIRGMVSFAEALSSKVSEDSGKWGILQKNKHGYYRTMTVEEGSKKGFK